jgi:hypothetical protein
MTDLVSQLVTAEQMESPVFARWVARTKTPLAFHRKLWEFAYILQALEEAGCLAPLKRGVGFGVGKEPLSAVLASRGCEVVATDLEAEASAGRGWIETDQHASALKDLNARGLCDADRFRRLVSFRPADMNHIPDDLVNFDFTWSSCSLEHLGSVEKGAAFVLNSIKCLKPGGVAVHTTEFNVASNDRNLAHGPVVLFRRKDIEALAGELLKEGHEIVLNFTLGDREFDRVVSPPPYDEPNVMKIRYQVPHCIGTSIGLIIRKKGGDSAYSPFRVAEKIRARGELERKTMPSAGFKERFKRLPIIGKSAVWLVALLKMPLRVKAIQQHLEAPPRPAPPAPRMSAYLGDHVALTTVKGLDIP